ncbi:MAG: hypothetical protein HWD85_02625 [Flavobacteriaceae bacterium]|nr:hypothetical protein [Flavobacteriaceae bacterium]
MIQKVFTVFFLWMLLFSATSIAQDSIPISPDLKEKNELNFQDSFFKALAQKAIFNYQVAIDNLERCNELQPKNVSVLFELSKNYLFLKKYLEAEMYAKEALQIEPKNYWVLQHLSDIYIKSRAIKKAIEVQKQLVVQNPKERRKLVYLYAQNNQLEMAKKILLAMEKEHVLTADLKLFKKRFFKKENIKKKPEPTGLKELIDEFEASKSFKSLLKVLHLLAKTKDKRLLAYSNKGLTYFPAQPVLYLMNAKALNNNKQYKKAIEQLTIGIDFVIDTPNLEANFYDELAISYKALGNEKEAIKHKNKALALRKTQK